MQPVTNLTCTLELVESWDRLGTNEEGTTSVLRTRRALDPRTGAPAAASEAEVAWLGEARSRVHRAFHLQRSDYLLGEPIVVELSVALRGPGVWHEHQGGNYRLRGRDDNFYFLVHCPDGTWASDPLALGDGPEIGGLSNPAPVTSEAPYLYAHALQQWASLSMPGRHDLYCFHAHKDRVVVGRDAALYSALPEELRREILGVTGNHLIDRATGAKSLHYHVAPQLVLSRDGQSARSPLFEALPEALAQRVSAITGFDAHGLTDVAQLSFTLREGDALERARMVQACTARVASEARGRNLQRSTSAERRAIVFSPQDDFLPLLERWLSEPQGGALLGQIDLRGLTLRTSPRALALLRRLATPAAVAAMQHLDPARLAEVIPDLIGYLIHPDVQMRSHAGRVLQKISGDAVEQPWDGFDANRPTLEEGRELQARFLKWWASKKK